MPQRSCMAEAAVRASSDTFKLESAAQARLKWRAAQPLTLLELRARRLRPPLALPARDSFWGCFSWVDVGAAAAAEAAERWRHGTPAIPVEEFAEKQAALRRALRVMAAEPLCVDGVELI